MAILREAADWISARGNPPWNHWYMDAGERILRDRIEHHEIYLALRNAIPMGTVTIQWNDGETWGEHGLSSHHHRPFVTSESNHAHDDFDLRARF